MVEASDCDTGMAIMLDPCFFMLGFLSLLFLPEETIGKQNAISKGNTNSRLHVIGMFPFFHTNLTMES